MKSIKKDLTMGHIILRANNTLESFEKYLVRFERAMLKLSNFLF